MFSANLRLPNLPKGPFKPTWDSLKKYRFPRWYMDAKFGIFIHWGVYSVPAFQNEWYPRNMYIRGHPAYYHHLETYGPHDKFGYKDFIPMFTAENWDPVDWAKLFREAGARYVVLVAEHHDGFALYDCSYTRWNSVRMGPKRDIVGELAEAVRGEGLAFGVSYHRAEHWWFFEGGMHFNSDVRDPKYYDFYGPAKPSSTQPDDEFLSDWLRRACELVDKYKPQIFWFDWWIEQPVFEPYLRFFAAYYYNRAYEWGTGVVINYKHNAFPEGTAVLDIERGKSDVMRQSFWQTDTSICRKSWGYIKDHDYKPAGLIISDLVDIVSKNGCLLLNVAPKPDGTIPEEQRKILLDVGEWLKINGGAIYGSRPWTVYGEGPTKVIGGEFKEEASERFTGKDIRFTSQGDTLFAILLNWPGGEAEIKSLSTMLTLYPYEIGSVEMLGVEEPLQWTRNEDGLRVKMPERKPCEHAYTLKINRFKGRKEH
ncbi:MAG: alpha-L-fucosidase [Candidatus Bathyarchaeia archaeon]